VHLPRPRSLSRTFEKSSSFPISFVFVFSSVFFDVGLVSIMTIFLGRLRPLLSLSVTFFLRKIRLALSENYCPSGPPFFNERAIELIFSS